MTNFPVNSSLSSSVTCITNHDLVEICAMSNKLSFLFLCALFLIIAGSQSQFIGVRKEKISIGKRGSLGVRLSSDFKVLEVIDADSMLLLDDRITAVDGDTIIDKEFAEFKDILANAKVPFVLSVDRPQLDRVTTESVADNKPNAQFMANNKNDGISFSASLTSLGNELGLHLPIVSVKEGKSGDLLQNFVSEAAQFSGPFRCDYNSLRAAYPLNGCQVAANDKKKRIYKDTIVVVMRGVCPFAVKGDELTSCVMCDM